MKTILRTRRKILLPVMLPVVVLVSGCASLPSNGPTGATIMSRSSKTGEGSYRVETITSTNVPPSLFNAKFETKGAETILPISNSVPEQIVPGDVLSIRIYEIGVALFSGTTSAGSSVSTGSDLIARSELFQRIDVDRDGTITLPYLGKLKVDGKTLREAEHSIRAAMRGKSQSPDVLVTRIESPGTAISIAGSVARPGPLPLSVSPERLLDVIARAGGTPVAPYDAIVRFTRQGVTRISRLNDIDPSDPITNMLVGPGDRVEILKDPRTFIAMGAVGRVSEIDFAADTLTLAQAIARIGGPNDSQADARSVFLFRHDPNLRDGKQRVIYRINLMDPQSYFVAQSIGIQDNDLIFVANARANLPAKFVSIINQLFAPAVTLRAVTQ